MSTSSLMPSRAASSVAMAAVLSGLESSTSSTSSSMPERRSTEAASSISASTGTTEAPLLYVASTTVPRSSGISATVPPLVRARRCRRARRTDTLGLP